MYTFKRSFVIALLAVSGGMVSAPAQAACCVFDSASIVQAIQTAQTAIVNTVNNRSEVMRLAMIKAIQGATQITVRAQSQGSEMVADTVTKVQTGLETTRNDSAYQELDVCGVLAPTMGPADALRTSPGLGGGFGRGGSGGGGGGVGREMRLALDVAAGRAIAPSQEVMAASAAKGACNTFAATNTSNLARAQACNDAGSGFSPANTNGTPDADVRAETLFIGPQTTANPSEFKRRLTVEADGKDKNAIEAYMRNLNTPVDLRQLKKAELQSDAGRQYMAYRDAFEARMALAERPARALVGNRVGSQELIPMLQQLSSGVVFGAHVKDYLAKNVPTWQSRGISIDEMFNMEAERRYLNPKWHLEMASMPPETHQREQSQMMALQTMLLVRMLEKLDTMSVVNGQVAASAVRKEMLPQLITLHNAVAK